MSVTPLEKLVTDHAYAQSQLDDARKVFEQRMDTIARQAHATGITRYMAQKATGASQSEVAAWFGDLPTSKPGRRRKDDPIYGGSA